MDNEKKMNGQASVKWSNRENCVGICPYYLRDRGNGKVYCECAKFQFPDKLARREIVYGFCAHPANYKKCAIKQAMDHYYERKFSMIDADEKGGAGYEATE